MANPPTARVTCEECPVFEAKQDWIRNVIESWKPAGSPEEDLLITVSLMMRCLLEGYSQPQKSDGLFTRLGDYEFRHTNPDCLSLQMILHDGWGWLLEACMRRLTMMGLMACGPIDPRMPNVDLAQLKHAWEAFGKGSRPWNCLDKKMSMGSPDGTHMLKDSPWCSWLRHCHKEDWFEVFPIARYVWRILTLVGSKKVGYANDLREAKNVLALTDGEVDELRELTDKLMEFLEGTPYAHNGKILEEKSVD